MESSLGRGGEGVREGRRKDVREERRGCWHHIALCSLSSFSWGKGGGKIATEN